MAIFQGQCTSFKTELLQAVHNFSVVGGDTFKLALYTASANLGAGTTVYTTSGEVTGTNYTAGGAVLTKIQPTSSGTTAFVSFNPLTFSNVTLTTRGALIYNASKANKAVCVLNFGIDVTKTAANLVIVFPPASAADAILRIA